MQHQPQLAPQIRFSDIAHIFAIDGDLAVLDFIKTGEQVDDGGLSRPGWPNQGNGLPGFGLQGHILDDQVASVRSQI